MDRRYKWLKVCLAVPGVAALFLPFIYERSPLQGLGFLVRGDYFWGADLAAVPALLALPIAAWQLRGLSPSGRRSSEIALAYFLSAAAMLYIPFVTIYFVLSRSWESSPAGLPMTEAIAFASSWGLVLATWIAARKLRTMRLNESAAELFLTGGYLPTPVWFLISWLHSPFNIGAWIVGIACVAYLATMVLVYRHPHECA